jgi:hypothetical protein
VISWIVASHKEDVLTNNLMAHPFSFPGDEVIVVRDAESITKAYAQGQSEASNRVRVYVHSDVQIVNSMLLRKKLYAVATHEVGMIGVVGSKTMIMPWWVGPLCGSVWDSRLGVLNYGDGGPCAVVDGLLLATVQHVYWDEDWPGWHGYDQDACAQMQVRGLQNWCIRHELVQHHTDSPIGEMGIDGYPDAVTRFHKKWSHRL